MQEVTAWLAEMQAMVTVCPGVESGKPGENEKIPQRKATCSESGLLGNVGRANLLLNCAGTQVVHLQSKWVVAG